MQKNKYVQSNIVVLSDNSRQLNTQAGHDLKKLSHCNVHYCYDASEVFSLLSNGDIEMQGELNVILADTDQDRAQNGFIQLMNLKKRLPGLNMAVTALLPSQPNSKKRA